MVVKANEDSLLNIYLTFRWIFYVNYFVDLVMCYYLSYVGQASISGWRSSVDWWDFLGKKKGKFP